jgi:hypothetical protein
MIFTLINLNRIETKGENNTPSLLKFDLYIINQSISLEDFNKILIDANKIWGEYNVSFELNKIYWESLNDTEKSFLLEVNATNNEECKKYNQIINFSNNSHLKVIILTNANSSKKGRGCICGCESVIIGKEIVFFQDLTGWNFAHEFGHILGLLDLSNRYNLMCDELKLISPKFLNKNQTKSVTASINTRFIQN